MKKKVIACLVFIAVIFSIMLISGTITNGVHAASKVINTNRIKYPENKTISRNIVLFIGNPYMKINDLSKEIDPGRGTVPVILEGRTLVPVKAVVEEIGGTIKWDEKERKVTIKVKDRVINLWIDKKTTQVNGTDKVTDAAPKIINARTMLPLRFVAENLGCEVNWEETTKKITIVAKGAIPEPIPEPEKEKLIKASVVEPEGSQSKIAAVVTPVYMYYLERYFSDINDKTQTDWQIKSILDNSPEGRALLLKALEKYREIPEETKYQIFDAQTVQLTATITQPLNLESIRERIKQEGESILVKQPKGPPAASSALVAKNVSKFADPDTPGSEKYRIELKWQDNSNDEDGFRIYRVFKGAGIEVPGGRLDLVASVGPNVATFIDSLTKPANNDDQYCYQVTAFKSAALARVGQPPEIMESGPSNQACSYYDPLHTLSPPLPDLDKDGVPDKDDECPGVPGDWPHGCPDKDGDGVNDFKDKCPNEYYPSEDGCPIKYNLRWMGMHVLNNSAAYNYPGANFVDEKGMPKGLYDNEGDKDAWGLDGEEPYLIFAWTNGMLKLEGQGGMMIHGGARWCCGERVDVKQGKNYEPDEDSSGEEYPLNLNDLRDHGLQVFPAAPGKFSPIDGDLGLVLTVTLMERDWKTTITPDKQANALEAAFKVGGAVVGAVSTCVGTGGLGCLVSIGGAMKTVIETIFGLSQSAPPPVVVDEPDDFQGTEAWAITRGEADYKTSDNGAYAFWFELPMKYLTYNGFWWPFGPGAGSSWITKAIGPVRARLYFCLYREGTPESEIKKACSSYKQVLPWPMVP